MSVAARSVAALVSRREHLFLHLHDHFLLIPKKEYFLLYMIRKQWQKEFKLQVLNLYKKAVKWPRKHIKVELKSFGMCVSQDCLRYFGKCLKIPSIFSVSTNQQNFT